MSKTIDDYILSKLISTCEIVDYTDGYYYVTIKEVRYLLGCTFKIPKRLQVKVIHDLKRSGYFEVLNKNVIRIKH